MGQLYLCKKCGYRGSFVLETDVDNVSSSEEKTK